MAKSSSTLRSITSMNDVLDVEVVVEVAVEVVGEMVAVMVLPL